MQVSVSLSMASLKHLCVVQFNYIALCLVVIILSYEKYVVFAALNVSALGH